MGDITRITLNKKDRSQLTMFLGAVDATDDAANSDDGSNRITGPQVFRFENVPGFTDALRAAVQLYKMQQKVAVEPDEKYVPPSAEDGTPEEQEPMI